MSNMVVVISDLHLEEEQTDLIPTADSAEPIALRRNVPGSVFESLVANVVRRARQREVARIDFVLAGDVFDLHRTQLWFTDDCPPEVRPFVDNGQVGSDSPLERKILAILDAILAETEVKRSVEAFQQLAQGFYLEGGTLVPIGIPVTLHYLPGNHDRLANATPAIRRRVREILKLGGDDALFPHNFMFEDPNVFVRHGHEYDPVNFGSRLKGWRIERDIRPELYDQCTMGDFVTVQVASRLPNLFRRHYREQILSDLVLRTVYLRLLEFDDLRPQSIIVGFILDVRPPKELAAQYNDNRKAWQALMWHHIEPVMCALLDDVRAALDVHPHIRGLLPWYARLLLALRPWRWGVPLWVMQSAAWALKYVDGGGQPERYAAREQALDDGADFVAAGHTHEPQVAHLFTGHNGRKKYFVDTGTWRNAVLGSFRQSYFGRVDATTYAAFYGSFGTETRSFEYRSSVQQTWPVDDFDR